MYIRDLSVFSQQRNYEEHFDNLEKRQYTFRLKKDVYDEVSKDFPVEQFFTLPAGEKLIILGKSWDVRNGSEIFISKFDSMNTEIFVEQKSQYSVSAQWILRDGRVSTLSEHTLVSNVPSDDKSPPLILDELRKLAYLYKRNIISLSSVVGY